jgi:hypothetical protein
VVGYIFDKNEILKDVFCFQSVSMSIQAFKIAKNGRFLVIGQVEIQMQIVEYFLDGLTTKQGRIFDFKQEMIDRAVEF